jgi:hypothetical protein
MDIFINPCATKVLAPLLYEFLGEQEILIRHGDTEPAEIIPSQGVFELRRGRTLVKSIIPETKYETLTFKCNCLRKSPEKKNRLLQIDFSC